MTWRRCSEEMPEAWKDALVWIDDKWGATIAYVNNHGAWSDSHSDWPIGAEVLFWQPITPPDEDATASQADNQGATTPDEGTPHGNSDERTA